MSKSKITIDLDKMSKGWFGETQRDYLWKIVDYKGRVLEIQVLDHTKTREDFNSILTGNRWNAVTKKHYRNKEVKH